MKTCAVICEYNPFHKGHAVQFSRIRERIGNDALIIALMSGNYTQRGEIAVLPKYERAEAAVRASADVVLEIPFPFCCSQASVFAGAGTTILDTIGGIDHLAFGSESGDETALTECAATLCSEEYAASLKTVLREEPSLSLPRAREKAFGRISGGFYPKKPNDILAAEYLISLKKRGSKIKPLCIRREEDGFSASSAREMLKKGDLSLIPEEAKKIYARDPSLFADVERGAALILGSLRMKDLPSFTAAAEKADSVSGLVASLTNKTHTSSSVRRGLIRAVFGLPDICGFPAYTTLLGANEKGRAFLRSRKGFFPILTKPAHFRKLPPEARNQFETAKIADSVYPLFLPHERRGENPFLQGPYLQTN